MIMLMMMMDNSLPGRWGGATGTGWKLQAFISQTSGNGKGIWTVYYVMLELKMVKGNAEK